MTDTEIKQLFELKKETIIQSFRSKATLDKWDGHSSIWAYSLLTGESQEITEPKVIKIALSFPQSFVHYFLTKESMETYKWTHELIEAEIDNRIAESFNSGKAFANFVNYKDICLGDAKTYYVSD